MCVNKWKKDCCKNTFKLFDILVFWSKTAWKEEKTAPERPDNNHPEVEVAETHSDEKFQLGQCAVAIYEGKWYIGKIVETDSDDESDYTYQISFLEKKIFFQWSSLQDIIWCRITNIMFKASDPIWIIWRKKPPTFWAIWRHCKIGRKVGGEKSPGKTSRSNCRRSNCRDHHMN